ncbi:hypothetical protein Tco_1029786 [Tanacetum coccineum]|uniref:Uncharacterized protein n=1 Tax=Tanacetum coccineum TaxID=301880 RepID=A0ABQ5G5T4_9ASTR
MMHLYWCQKDILLQSTNGANSIDTTNPIKTDFLKNLRQQKIKKREFDELQLENTLKSFIYNITLRMLKWKPNRGNSYLIDILEDILGKDMSVSFSTRFDSKTKDLQRNYALYHRMHFSGKSPRKIDLQEWIRRIREKPIRHTALPPREQRHRFLRPKHDLDTPGTLTMFVGKEARRAYDHGPEEAAGCWAVVFPCCTEDASAIDRGTGCTALVTRPHQPPTTRPPHAAMRSEYRSGEIIHTDDDMYNTVDGC